MPGFDTSVLGTCGDYHQDVDIQEELNVAVALDYPTICPYDQGCKVTGQVTFIYLWFC